jgi:hypothetical protein
MSVVISLGKSLIRGRASGPTGLRMHVTAIAGQKCRRVDAAMYPMETNGGIED